MENERERNHPGRDKLSRGGGEGQAMEFERLVRRAPQFRGLAKVAGGDEKELTAAQEKFLNEFAVGLAKGVDEGKSHEVPTEPGAGKPTRRR